MAAVGPRAGGSAFTLDEVRNAARDSVQEVVAAGGTPGRQGRGWAVPLTAASVVAAAACAPVAWPLLAGGVAAAPSALAALTAAFSQLGGVGGALLSEAVIRAWDRMRARGDRGAGQRELREALAEELQLSLVSSSPAAAGLRAELAGVLRGVDAVKVALSTTVKASVQQSGDQTRAVLIRGLRDLGTQFTEFGWLLDEIGDQLARIAEMQAEMAAESRALLEAQQRTLMHVMVLRQENRQRAVDGELRSLPGLAGGSSAQERVLALQEAEIAACSECPYPGLASYGPQDADRFFGREQLSAVLITRLAEQLARPGFLMIVGPSGSGKSSLLRAGLLPAIAAGGLPVQGTDSWPLDLMTPGPRPLLELASRVAVLAGIPAGALEADLRADPGRIAAAIRQAMITHVRRKVPSARRSAECPALDAGGHPGDRLPSVTAAKNRLRSEDLSPRLVLIVDQFEELFTHCADESERRLFIRALCAAAGTNMPTAHPRESDGPQARRDAHDAPALVAIGVRADFYTRSAAYPELVPYLQDCQVLVGPMDQAGLRAAIGGPASRAGLVVEPGLVELLLADLRLRDLPAGRAADTPDPAATVPAQVGETEDPSSQDSYEAGRLPLLAYALQQTWQHREGRSLTVAGYRATGGIDGAIARAAETIYEGLGTESKQVLRRLLLRMVTLGEGTADTRRRVTITEVTGTTALSEPTLPEETARATAIRPVLADLVQARLLTAGTDSGGAETVQISHEALLWAWPRLRQWLSQDRAGQRIQRDLTDATQAWKAQDHESSHLFGGTRLALAYEWADSHRQDLNADEEAFLSASRRRERGGTRLRRATVAALTMLTLVSAIAAGLAVHDNNQAVHERDQAIIKQIAAEAQQLQTTNPSLAAQLALVNRRLDPASDNTAQLLSLADMPLSSVLTGPTVPVYAVAVSPNGHTLAAGSNDGTIRLWNITNPSHPLTIGHPLRGKPFIEPGGIFSIAFSPAGNTLVAGSGNGTVWLWNVTNPAHPSQIAQRLSLPGEVNSLAFSPNGHVLAVAYYQNAIRMWNVANPAHPTWIGQVSAGQDRTDYVHSVAFSPDGRTLAAGSTDGAVWLWNITNPAHSFLIGKPQIWSTDPVWSVAFSPDGRTLAVGTAHGAIGLWDVSDPADTVPVGQPIIASAAPVESLAFSPNGLTLAAGSQDGAIRLWNVSDLGYPVPLGPPLTGPAGAVWSVAFSPDGRTLAAGNDDGTIRLWSLPSTVLANLADVPAVAFSPDGRILAASDKEGTTRLWNVTRFGDSTPIGQPFTGSAAPINAAVFSPDGRTLAVGSDDGDVRLWNVTDPGHPTQIGQPIAGSYAVNSLAFSPDEPPPFGLTLAVGRADGIVRLWDVTDPAHVTPVGQPLAASAAPVVSVAFSRDGQTLAVAGSFLGTTLWNVDVPAAAYQLGPALSGSGGYVASVAFSPDGRILAAANTEGPVQLWNVTNPAHPIAIRNGITGPDSHATSVAFSANGHTLAAGSNDGNVWLWNVTDPDHPTQIGALTGLTSSADEITFSPDGHILAAGSEDGAIRLWNLNINEAISRICATTNGNLTAQQWTVEIPQLPYDPPCRRP
jgi:WD40 repeat protein